MKLELRGCSECGRRTLQVKERIHLNGDDRCQAMTVYYCTLCGTTWKEEKKQDDFGLTMTYYVRYTDKLRE